MKTTRWAVFISGTGSNLQALLEMRDFADVALVVSSRPDAYGLLRARRAGVPTLVLSKKINWRELSLELKNKSITTIFLAGFMRVIPQEFVEEWQGRIVNVHPSLLPLFPGLNSIERSVQAGGPVGVTVHEVVKEVDAGQVLLQRTVWDQTKHRRPRKQMRLEQAEYLVHLSEHRLVREVFEKWKRA